MNSFLPLYVSEAIVANIDDYIPLFQNAYSGKFFFENTYCLSEKKNYSITLITNLVLKLSLSDYFVIDYVINASSF